MGKEPPFNAGSPKPLGGDLLSSYPATSCVKKYKFKAAHDITGKEIVYFKIGPNNTNIASKVGIVMTSPARK